MRHVSDHVISFGVLPKLWKCPPAAIEFAFTQAGRSGALRQSQKRDPGYQDRAFAAPNANSGVKVWHQDCGAKTRWAALWSDRKPTEFLLADGTEYTPRPYELVLWDNATIHHRHPKMDVRTLRKRHTIIVRMTTLKTDLDALWAINYRLEKLTARYSS